MRATLLDSPAALLRRLALTAALLTLWIGSGPAAAADERPNLLVVLTDDLSADLLDAMIDLGVAPHIEQHLVQAGSASKTRS